MQSASIIQLAVTDSTNNYAMHLLDGNKARHGTMVIANIQTDGKGQRGREWVANQGESVLMSVILAPAHNLLQQFQFNASVALAIVSVLQDLYANWQVRIKWPNDIIINDKKAGGILIENVLRGSLWTNSVVGIGVNLLQNEFPSALQHAISLKMAAGIAFDRLSLAVRFRDAIVASIGNVADSTTVWNEFNNVLYKKGESQLFATTEGVIFNAVIVGANSDSSLTIQHSNGRIENFFHGQYIWQYSSLNQKR